MSRPETQTEGMPEEGVFYADGTINEVYVIENYGLGVEEASQEIKFGAHTGTLAQMLADEECPVGDQLKKTYQAKGIDGVVNFFEGVKVLDPDFSVVFSETTFERERTKPVPGPLSEKPTTIDSPEKTEKYNDPPQSPDKPDRGVRAAHKRVAAEDIAAEQATLARREAKETDVPPTDSSEDSGERTTPSEPVQESDNQMAVDRPVAPAKPVQPLEKPAAIVTVVSSVHESAAESMSIDARAAPEPVTIQSYEEEKTSPLAVSESAEATGRMVAEVAPFNDEEYLELVEDSEPVIEEAVEALVRAPEEMIVEDISEAYDFMTILQSIDEETIAESGHVVTTAVMELAAQVTEAWEQPETMASESVQTAIAKVMDAAEAICLLELAGEDITESEERLVMACQALLEELGLRCEPAMIEQFAGLILAVRKLENPDKHADNGALEVVLNDDGTHEFKPGNLDISVLFFRARQKLIPLRELGRWAMNDNLAISLGTAGF